MGLDQWRPCNNGFSRDFLLESQNSENSNSTSKPSSNRPSTPALPPPPSVGGHGSSVLASLSEFGQKYPNTNPGRNKNPSFVSGPAPTILTSQNNLRSGSVSNPSGGGAGLSGGSGFKADRLKSSENFPVELSKLYPDDAFGPRLSDIAKDGSSLGKDLKDDGKSKS